MESDSSEILRLKDDLQKRITEKDISGAKDILNALSDVSMTVRKLKVTKIGLAVNELRKHEDKELANQAKSLVKDWKRLTAESTSTKSSSSSTNNTSSPGVSTNSSAQPKSTVSSTITSAQSNSANSDPTKDQEEPPKSKQTTKLHLVQPPKALARQKICSLLANRLQQLSKEHCKDIPERNLETMSKNAAYALEDALFEEYGGSDSHTPSKDYNEKIRSFHFNLGQNVALALGVVKRKIDVKQLARTPTAELASDEFKKQTEQYYQAGLEEVQLDWDEKNRQKQLESAGIKAQKGQFKCGSCGSRNTDYFQKQTRSADEPMTTFVQCIDCGHRWKFC